MGGFTLLILAVGMRVVLSHGGHALAWIAGMLFWGTHVVRFIRSRGLPGSGR